MPRYTLEEKAVLDILKAVSDINLDPGYTAMYLNQSMGPAMRVLEEVLRLSGYHKIGNQEATSNQEDNDDELHWGVPAELDENATSFALQAEILGQLWLEYRSEEMLSDLLEYSDLGFPLAYAYSNDLIVLNEQSANFIVETFRLLLEAMGEDPGHVYNSVEDFMDDLEFWLETGGEESNDNSEENWEDDNLVEEHDSDLAYMDYLAKQKGVMEGSESESDYKI